MVAIALVLYIFTAIGVTAADDIKVTFNGANIEFDQPPILRDGRTLVPMRAIFEAMGAEVDWDGETETVWANKGDIVIALQIYNNLMFKNDGTKTEQIELDVPACIENSRTLVPVRAISEAFGAEVDWDGETQTVIIKL